MDEKLFRQLLEKGVTKARPHGKANWNKIRNQLTKDGGIYTTSQIWEQFVKRVVNRYRCKEWLHEQAEKGICLRAYKGGQYYWTFNPELVEKYAKKGQ